MRIGQVLAQTPLDCTLLTIYATVWYGPPRRYWLTGYAFGEVGSITKRVKFAAQTDQTEFDDKGFDSAVANAGFQLAERPIKGTGTEYIYHLRPLPSTPPAEMGFSLHSRSQGNIEKRLQQEAQLAAFTAQVERNLDAYAPTDF